MGIEEFLENADPHNLKGKLLTYGKYKEKTYAIYATDKTESYAVEMSDLMGDSASLEYYMNGAEELKTNFYKENNLKPSDTNFVLHSVMFEIDDIFKLHGVDADKMDLGEFENKKKLNRELVNRTMDYFNEYEEQRQRRPTSKEDTVGYDKKIFINSFVIPYIDSTNMGSEPEKMKERNRLRSYANREGVHRDFKSDIDKIIYVMENRKIDTHRKIKWMEAHLNLMDSYVNEDYRLAATLLEEREKIEIAIDLEL